MLEIGIKPVPPTWHIVLENGYAAAGVLVRLEDGLPRPVVPVDRLLEYGHREGMRHLDPAGQDLLHVRPVQVRAGDVVQLGVHPVQPLSHRVHRQTVRPLHLNNSRR